MKKKLFQYAILYHQTTIDEAKKEQISTLIVIQPETILATDEKTALLKIAKKIPDTFQEDLQNVEILLRPF